MSPWKQNPSQGIHVPPLRVQAPHFSGEPICPTSALHAALGLARRADGVLRHGVAIAPCQIIEPILAGTYVLISEEHDPGQWLPVGWLAYALFDADAERRHLNDPAQALMPKDWVRGDRLWMVHWMASSGYTRSLVPLLQRLFVNLTARSLDRHSERIVTWRGLHCSPLEASKFWSQRPLLALDGMRDASFTPGERFPTEHGMR